MTMTCSLVSCVLMSLCACMHVGVCVCCVSVCVGAGVFGVCVGKASAVQYLIGVVFTQSLHREELGRGITAVLERENLNAAVLEGFQTIVKVIQGLCLVLCPHTDKTQTHTIRDTQ